MLQLFPSKFIVSILVTLAAMWMAVHAAMADPDAPNDADFSPLTLITLHMKNVPAAEVLAEINKQASFRITALPANSLKEAISLDLDQTPFWPAMAQFFSLTRTEPGNTIESSEAFSIRAMAPGAGDFGAAMQNSGMFCFVPTLIQSNRNVRNTASTSSGEDTLAFQILVDPKMRVTQWQQPVLESAEDENGLSLMPTRPPVRTISSAGEITAFQLVAPMHFPPQRGKRVADVRGSFVLSAATTVGHIVVPDVAQAVGKTISKAGRTLTIDSISADTKAPHIRVTFTRVPGSGLKNREILSELAGLRCMDATGKIIAMSGSSDSKDPDFLTMDYFPQRPAAARAGATTRAGAQLPLPSQTQAASSPIKMPLKMTWDFPANEKSMNVTFEFKDIPLPQ